MSPRPLVLLVPSRAAATELPRRLASTGRAVAGIRALTPLDLARAIAEPTLLGRGLKPWTPGHAALVAARLLAGGESLSLRCPEGTPRAPVAAALAHTLLALRQSGVAADRLDALARSGALAPEEKARLAALASLHRSFGRALEDTADPVTILAAAREALPGAPLLDGAEVLLVDDLELEPAEREFVLALTELRSVRMLSCALTPSLGPLSLRAQLATRGVAEAPWAETPLAPIAPLEPPPSLRRLREALFEPPAGEAALDGAVELLTAPGEAAEARAIARRILREAARGVPFEEMGILLPRSETYAPLFTDLLSRLGIPHRLHPSLPLRFGRAARSLLLLFRCRGLERPAVMEFLSFAPIDFGAMLGTEAEAHPSRWDEISRQAGIVSGYGRWMVGLRAWAEAEREAADEEPVPEWRERRVGRVADADALLRLVGILRTTLDGLAGEASWPEWVELLKAVCDQWIGPEVDRDALLDLVADLGALGSVASRASWDEVEQVLTARLDWERLPMRPLDGGAVHVGVFDAIAGVPFRFVAIPGLVEGGYPGVFRPDPFLLDAERVRLQRAPAHGSDRPRSEQLDLFAELPAATAKDTEPRASAVAAGTVLPTTQDRLLEARRLFHRAVSQASERLVLSYPRADARSGRERLPSLFFAAAAATLAGRPLAGPALESLVTEDDPQHLPLEDALDPGERDRLRLLREDVAATIAAGSAFFRQSRLATQARWSGRLTRYDGFLSDLDDAVRARLDPLAAPGAISASRLASYARCGFLYLLQHVLHLRPAPEPEERRRIEPLERGSLFHQVTEHFLRERRDRGELPVRDSEPIRRRLREMAEEALEGLVAGSPPRYALLWQREKRRFHRTMEDWLVREAAVAGRSTPLHFEVSFGLGRSPDDTQPHDPAPLEIDLGDGALLRVCGRIDRIDRRAEGGLVVRDYKTGRAPRDDGGIFRGGKQLQIPFYVLAAEKLFPGERVVEAFLDYVDGGRQVAFRPEVVAGASFRALLRQLVALVARGAFVQEPTACDFCDFTAVCGPKALIERRRAIKLGDPTLQQYLRLRDVG